MDEKQRNAKAKKPKEPTPQDLMKAEIAKELGLYDKAMQEGWGNLTAAESGRIGGLLGHRFRRGDR